MKVLLAALTASLLLQLADCEEATCQSVQGRKCMAEDDDCDPGYHEIPAVCEGNGTTQLCCKLHSTNECNVNKPCTADNTICIEEECVCKEGYTPIWEQKYTLTCVNSSYYCTDSSDCIENGNCNNGWCECPENYVENTNGTSKNACIPFDFDCVYSKDCHYPSKECMDDFTCSCEEGYVRNPDKYGLPLCVPLTCQQAGGKCEAKDEECGVGFTSSKAVCQGNEDTQKCCTLNITDNGTNFNSTAPMWAENTNPAYENGGSSSQSIDVLVSLGLSLMLLVTQRCS